ncbi:hypothetical protein A2415_02675 [candidate division WWE3 bacterium RIFOXYC1_FULL_39_7]|uniref:Uncharacterized protein n=2 Tax=Katanobacteria TaxID=422282 RepID=A0A1F4X4L8_UNCKA|nr:MAG: hypothetical protein A2415_02675 [candidate division WWE3 bacterium RIFOXYC1_FULL_39_7]OGC76642.1 MAG: hypothetical protein A2619_04310 [candidate division WWE3 bacterium RIFOXYD1_FULL_39_9]
MTDTVVKAKVGDWEVVLSGLDDEIPIVHLKEWPFFITLPVDFLKKHHCNPEKMAEFGWTVRKICRLTTPQINGLCDWIREQLLTKADSQGDQESL